jgi:hypothetical protein
LGDDTAQVTLISDPRNLHVFIETTHPQLTVTFQEENSEMHALEEAAARENESHSANHKKHTKSKNGSGEAGESAHKKDSKDPKDPAEKENGAAEPEPFLRGGKLTVSKDGKWTVVNEKGEPLLSVAIVKQGQFKQGNGDNWTAEVRIPYTFVPGQNAWINGVDFGRYRVGIDTAPPRTICILSEAARVRKRLENCVLGSIDYWHKVWKDRGIIPSGWHSPTAPAGAWEVSDTGGYAHLIHAMAYWLIYQDGGHEWELMREQFPSAPKPAPALPASVLKAQGLR